MYSTSRIISVIFTFCSRLKTSEIPAGKVAKAYSKGFKQGDKVLRAAMVAVAVALPAPAGDPPTEAPAP